MDQIVTLIGDYLRVIIVCLSLVVVYGVFEFVLIRLRKHRLRQDNFIPFADCRRKYEDPRDSIKRFKRTAL